MRFLFGINWADSGPGFSWPADYHVAWLPGFDRWILVYSADSPDALGYCDIALGSFAPDVEGSAAVRGLLVADWRRQAEEWSREPWESLWSEENVSEDEALAWRGEAWKEEGGEEDEPGLDGDGDSRGGSCQHPG